MAILPHKSEGRLYALKILDMVLRKSNIVNIPVSSLTASKAVHIVNRECRKYGFECINDRKAPMNIGFAVIDVPLFVHELIKMS